MREGECMIDEYVVCEVVLVPVGTVGTHWIHLVNLYLDTHLILVLCIRIMTTL